MNVILITRCTNQIPIWLDHHPKAMVCIMLLTSCTSQISYNSVSYVTFWCHFFSLLLWYRRRLRLFWRYLYTHTIPAYSMVSSIHSCIHSLISLFITFHWFLANFSSFFWFGGKISHAVWLQWVSICHTPSFSLSMMTDTFPVHFLFSPIWAISLLKLETPDFCMGLWKAAVSSVFTLSWKPVAPHSQCTGALLD